MSHVENQILQYEKDRQKCVITLNRGEWQGQTFEAESSCCTDPVCQCSQITLECSPGEIDTPAADEKVRVVLDFIDCSLVECSGGGKIDAARLAGEIEGEATAKDWLLLEQLFLDAKRESMKGFDPASARLQLPPDLLADITRMATYTEFLPFDETMEFSLDGSNWVVDDHYCINPDCDCDNGVLLFYPKPAGADEQDLPEHEIYPAVHFDVKKGEATSVATEGSDSPSAMQLAAEFMKQTPDCVELLRKRRATLRTLIKHNLPPKILPFKRQEKVGRNDPCPCGSGKKYKKCCGR